MFNPFRRYTLEDARQACKDYVFNRSHYRIAVIDDKGFPLLDGLRASGFNIDLFNDIDNVYTIQPYDIVICDIRGVGKKFGSTYEGAFIIKEIKAHFPEKYVILHSGSIFKTCFNEYFRLSDTDIRKGTDLGEWVVNLENLCRDISDPQKQFNRMKAYLAAQKVPEKIILKLQDSYSRSIVKKDYRPFKRSAVKGMKKIAGEAVKIILESVTIQIIRNISNR